MNYQLRIIKAFFVILFFVIVNFALFIPSVSAHVLKTDGSIGAVVHINPEDDPVVGEETTIYFDVKDTSNQFKVENCDCRFIAKVNGEEVYEQVITTTTATYNFPEKNVYTLELVGNPKSVGQFQPFRLSYAVRVERESSPQNADVVSGNLSLVGFISDHVPHIFLLALVALICGMVIYHERKKN